MNRSFKLVKRFLFYLFGLFLITVGIAISVKSNLGVSPVSSIPYTITCVWGIEMGIATIIFHTFLVLLQVCIWRKEFKIKNVLQIPAGVVFGAFTTFCNGLMTYLPPVNSFIIRIIMILISVVFIAFGIFFYLPADIIPLAGEGAMKTISDKFSIEFPKVKIAFDVTMVVLSGVICLVFIKKLGSVGIGTVISSVLVGIVLAQIKKRLEQWRIKVMS